MGNNDPAAFRKNHLQFDKSVAFVIGINKYKNPEIKDLRTAVADARAIALRLKVEQGFDHVLLLTNTDKKTFQKLLRWLGNNALGGGTFSVSDRLFKAQTEDSPIGWVIDSKYDEGKDKKLVPEKIDKKKNGYKNLWLTRKADLEINPAKDSLVFYYAGHGFGDEVNDGPSGFLAPADCTYSPSTQVSMDDVYQALSSLNCLHTLLILDCCFAGKFKFSTTTKGAIRPFLVPLYERRLKRYRSSNAWQVLVSAGPDQKAYDSVHWVDLRGHSPFANTLKKALEGKADLSISRNRGRLKGDGLITATELFLYVWEEVEQITGQQKPQHPDLFEMRQHREGEFIFLNPQFDFDPSKLAEDKAVNPYKGLKPYENKVEDIEVFFGRERVVQEILGRLVGNSVMVVTGPSGSGKSSVVRAGVFPALKGFECRAIRPSDLLSRSNFKIGLEKGNLDVLLIDQLEEIFSHPEAERLQKKVLTIIKKVKKRSEIEYRKKAQEPLSLLLDQELEGLQGTAVEMEAPGPKLLFVKGPKGSGKTTFVKEHLLKILEKLGYEKHLKPPVEWIKDLDFVDRLDPEKPHAVFLDQYEELLNYPDRKIRVEQNLLAWIKKIAAQNIILIIAVREEFEPEIERSVLGEYWGGKHLFTLTPIKPILLFTMRSDFEWLLKNSLLKEIWHPYGIYRVPPMNQAELREAVTEPAWWAMYDFKDKTNEDQDDGIDNGEGLISRIVEELHNAPGALPLLSSTMEYFFEKSKGEPYELTFNFFNEKIKGVAGALSKKAEKEYQKLSPKEQMVMKRLFLRMVDFNGGDLIRRKVSYVSNKLVESSNTLKVFNELDFGEEQRALLDQVILKLGEGDPKENIEGANLIIIGSERGQVYIEPIHDSLVQYWDRFREWVDDFGVENLILHKKLGIAVKEFYFPEEQEAEILSYAEPLQDHYFEPDEEQPSEPDIQVKKKRQATLWHHNPRLLPLKVSLRESRYLKKELKRAGSKKEKGKEELLRPVAFRKKELIEAKLEEKKFEFNIWEQRFIEESVRRQNKRWRNIAYMVSGVIIALSALSIIAWIQRAEANKQRDAAEARSLAFQSNAYLGNDPTLALQLARQAIEKDAQSPTVQQALMEAFYTPIIDKELFYQKKVQHQRRINWAAFSLVGNQFLTASDDSLLKIWDYNGNCQDSLSHPGPVYRADFSPNGRLVCSSSVDSIYLWEPGQGLLASWKADSGIVTITSIDFSPDGKFLLSSSSDGGIVIWDLISTFPIPQKVREIKAHQKNVLSAAFSGDGRFILTSSADSTARLWDTSGVMRTSFDGHEGNVLSASFSSVGASLLTASSDGRVIVWDTIGSPPKIIQHPTFPKTAYYSNDGNLILTSCEDKMARIFDSEGNLKYILKGHIASLSGAFFSPDNNWVLTISADQTARLWNLNAQEKFISWYDVDGTLSKGVFSPNDDFILLIEEVGKGRLWNIDKTDSIDIEDIEDYNYTADFSSEGENFLVGSGNYVHLWDMNGVHQEIRITQNYDAWKTAMFSPVYSEVLTASDSTISLWDYQGNLMSQIPHKDRLVDARFSPNGNILSATTGHMGFIRTPRGDLKDSFPLPRDAIQQIDLLQDEKSVLAVFKNNEALLWPISGGDTIRFTHGDQIYSAEMLEKKQMNYILTASKDGTAKLWNEKGTPIFEYNNKLISFGHQNEVGVNSASISHNGKYILIFTQSKKAVLLLTPLGVVELLQAEG